MSTRGWAFDQKDFENFLETFDPIRFRYENEELKLTPDQYMRIERYERVNALDAALEPNYYDLYRDLRLVYGESEPIREYINAFNIVQKKVISKYLAIDGLPRLFNKQFFNFEWEMHLAINFSKHDQSYYRDHFIHQVKDAYEAMCLLESDKMGMLNKLQYATETQNTNIAKFVRKHSEIELDGADRGLREIWEERFNNKKKPIIEHIRANIFKSAFILAALFHDIGYPIDFTIKGKNKLSALIPSAHFFYDASTRYQHICSLLSHSFLFQVVDESILEREFEDGTHGTLSALAFLLSFYENGAIHRLSPAKRAAVELAALVIFDHTAAFQLLDDGEIDYFRPVFYRNPLSFLFRFCDDIQEWGRVYFLVDTNHTLRVCGNCRLPIVSCDYAQNGADKREIPICGCAPSGNPFPGSVIPDGAHNTHMVISDVEYRKLNHIRACDRVSFYKAKEASRTDLMFLPMLADTLTSAWEEGYLVNMEYSPYKLLQLSFCAPDFPKYRASEIKKLKKILSNAGTFPPTIVYTHLTTNPISLKIKIIEDFFRAYYVNHAKAFETKDNPDHFMDEMDAILSSVGDETAKRESICRLLNATPTNLGSDAPTRKVYSAIDKEIGILICQGLLSVADLVELIADDGDREALLALLRETSPREALIAARVERVMRTMNIPAIMQTILDRAVRISYGALAANARMKDHLNAYAVLFLMTKTLRALCYYVDSIRADGTALKKALASAFAKAACASMPLIHSFRSKNGLPCLVKLVEDHFLQESRHIDYLHAARSGWATGEIYLDIFKSEDEDVENIREYTDPENYKQYITKMNHGEQDMLDAHSDMYMFYTLSKEIGWD